MQKIDNQDLTQIVGGVSLSGTLINSFSTILKTITAIGRSFGSSIRRIASDNICPLS